MAAGRRLRRDRRGCVPCAAVHGLCLDCRCPAGGRALDGVGRAHCLCRARWVSGPLGGPGVHGRFHGRGHGRAPGRRRPRPRRRPDLRPGVGRRRVVPSPESCGWVSQPICSRHRCSSAISPGGRPHGRRAARADDRYRGERPGHCRTGHLLHRRRLRYRPAHPGCRRGNARAVAGRRPPSAELARPAHRGGDGHHRVRRRPVRRPRGRRRWPGADGPARRPLPRRDDRGLQEARGGRSGGGDRRLRRQQPHRTRLPAPPDERGGPTGRSTQTRNSSRSPACTWPRASSAASRGRHRGPGQRWRWPTVPAPSCTRSWPPPSSSLSCSPPGRCSPSSRPRRSVPSCSTRPASSSRCASSYGSRGSDGQSSSLPSPRWSGPSSSGSWPGLGSPSP